MTKSLKATLQAGCMPERRDLIEMLPPRLLAEFIDDLTFDPNTASQLETWRWLAKVAAIRLADYVARVDGPETTKAASGELTAFGDATVSTATSLQEAC